MDKKQIAEAVADGLRKAFKPGVAILDSEIQSVTAEIVKLIEEAPLVYGYEVNGIMRMYANKHPELDTHKARLTFIEPIVKEPCKHEPMRAFDSRGNKIEGAYRNKCTICGVELIAEWSAK